MKENIELYQEHGGVLYAKVGKSEITFFGHQISVGDDEITVAPNILRFKPTPEERAIFSEFEKPMTAKLLSNRTKSLIHELAFFCASSEEKVDLLKELKSDINQLLKKM